MGGARRSRWTLRPARAGLLAAGLASASLILAPCAVADEGLDETSHSRFVLDAKKTVVKATVSVTIRNVIPDQYTATGRTFYYYDAYGIPLPAGAEDVRAVSNGSALAVSFEATDDPSTKVATASFPPLNYGRSRTIEWTYVIPGEPVRSKDFTRVGRGYATFAAQGVGDTGQVTVEVTVPTSMTFESTSDGFTEKRGKRTVTYTADENTDDYGIWAAVSARDPEEADKRQLDVGDATISLQSFPGDKKWLSFVGKRVTEGLPVLEGVVGHSWPGGLETIREDVSPQVTGYAWFDPTADEIIIPEDLDEATLFHELTHAWLNHDTFVERWLSEGLTDVVSHRALVELRGDDAPAPRKAPDRDASVALPLSTWESNDRSTEVDDYGYAASYTAVSRLLSDLDDKTFTAVVSAAYDGKSAYEAPGSSTVNQGRTDWRRFLDLVEIRAGVPDATKVFRTWVLTAEERKLLDERADAREVYREVDAADGQWAPPRGLRNDMSRWRFESAATIVDQLGDAPSDAASVQDAAARAGLSVPAPVREAYEDAGHEDDYAALATLLPRASEVIGVVGEASRVAAADRDPFSDLGQVMLAVDDIAANARADLAAGELDPAAERADAATSRAELALWVGIGIVVLGLALLAGAVFAVVGLRRRRRNAAANEVDVEDLAGEQPEPTLVGTAAGD